MYSVKRLPFHKKLFFVVSTFFVGFVLTVFIFQYNRERNFRIELLNTTLQGYNDIIAKHILSPESDFGSCYIDSLIHTFSHPNVRVTILDPDGKVVLESTGSPTVNKENHANREEIIKAKKKYGNGWAIRKSATLKQVFFYSAKNFDHLIIRSSLPFIDGSNKLLQVDKQFVYFLIIITVTFILILSYYSTKLGKSITLLQDFSNRAEQGLPIKTYLKPTSNDIGMITGSIIAIYQKLIATKSELSNERDKLFKHFQFSKEGLAIFSATKEAIIANNLFVQYVNVISDTQLSRIEGVLKLPEMHEINRFLEDNLLKSERGDEFLSHTMSLFKNCKSFLVECIIFQDGSFEVSINDVTLQEEDGRLKRQLTQNIAHELKTPISSIQGYMETIINNPTLDEERKLMFIERCYAQTIRLSGLLNDISILNRIDESGNLFDKEIIDLNRMISDITTDSTLALQNRQMHVVLQLPDKLVLEGNNSLLYSIFRNLMDNAIAYAGEGTTISISCYMQDKDYYYFSFSDNGVGVSSEHLNRLFERFYRVDKGRSRKLGGTGLGLAIVKNAIYFHKGEISAKNRPDGGLEFLFALRRT